MTDYARSLREFQAEKARLIDQKRALEERLERLERVISDVERLADESDDPLVYPPEPMSEQETESFTDRVRQCLLLNDARSLLPKQIRDMLLNGNPTADQRVRQNTLVHVHNTLKRLERQGEVELASMGRYRWKQKDYPVFEQVSTVIKAH